MCCSKQLIDYDDIIDKPETINKSITDLEWKVLDASRRTHEEIILNQWNSVPIQNYTVLFEQDEIDQINTEVQTFKINGLNQAFMDDL